MLTPGMQELWRLTPPSHSDHLPSVSLYQSMRMIAHVLHEVKVREEEYDFVKNMSSRVEGLLPSVQLARRERRLLWHGELVYHPTSSKADAHGRRNSHARSAPTVLSSGSSNRSGQHRAPTIVVSPCPDSPALDESKQWSNSTGKRAEKGSSVQPFIVRVSIFTDILLLAEMVSRADADGGEKFGLLLDVGISKILDMSLQEGPGKSLHSTVFACPRMQCNSDIRWYSARYTHSPPAGAE